jgi:hypothetical protein
MISFEDFTCADVDNPEIYIQELNYKVNQRPWTDPERCGVADIRETAKCRLQKRECLPVQSRGSDCGDWRARGSARQVADDTAFPKDHGIGPSFFCWLVWLCVQVMFAIYVFRMSIGPIAGCELLGKGGRKHGCPFPRMLAMRSCITWSVFARTSMITMFS